MEIDEIPILLMHHGWFHNYIITSHIYQLVIYITDIEFWILQWYTCRIPHLQNADALSKQTPLAARSDERWLC